MNLFHLPMGRGLRSQRSQQELAVALNDRQHVVKIVRDPPGEPPDRFHLLRLAELLLALAQGLLRTLQRRDGLLKGGLLFALTANHIHAGSVEDRHDEQDRDLEEVPLGHRADLADPQIEDDPVHHAEDDREPDMLIQIGCAGSQENDDEIREEQLGSRVPREIDDGAGDRRIA